MTVKAILELDDKKLVEMMTAEEFDRMKKLGLQYVWQLLDLMQAGCKIALEEENTTEDEEYTTIDEYLKYLEEMKEV